MSRPITIVLCMATALLAGCDNAPGRRAIDTDNVAPDKILDFDVLYRANCAGCHGPNGRGGAALALANPTYVAIADAGVIRRVTADGIAGTPMPAFARRSGGILTDEQIDAIVTGIRVSDQGLRTTVIAGRPDLGAPDWRGNVRGKTMTSQEISDVVAWLSAQRPERGTP